MSQSIPNFKPLIEKVEETEAEQAPEPKEVVVETQITEPPKAAKPKRGRKKKNAD